VLIPSENNRFKEIIDINSYKNLDENNSTSIRFMNYKCGIKSLMKRPIFGYGIGDVQEQMDLCYEEENANFPKKRYNTHNQYLFIWLSSGIIGFITFIAILFYYFKKSLQFKDEVMFSILVLYSFTFLFENVLSRQSGVIFFCFIINYFLWNNFNKKKVLSTHE
jgi:O-antigen ligase